MKVWLPFGYLGDSALHVNLSVPLMTPSERWPSILLHLDADSWTRATDLARRLEVSTRTVYRDVQAMVEAGVPLKSVPGKGYRLPEDYLIAPIRLTTDEAVMLVLGSTYAAQNMDGRYRAAAETAGQKLENALPPEHRERAHTLQGSVHLVPPHVFGDSTEEGLLQTIRQGLVEERTLVVERSDGEATSPQQSLDPYGLVRQGPTWYVVGHEHRRDRVAHVRLDEIEALRLTDESFERPSSYGTPPEGPSTPAHQRVRVVFDAEVASSVRVAPSVTVSDRELLPDGRLQLTLTVNDGRKVMSWLLSWGTHVHVLEPRALRDRVAAEARAVADQYESGPTLLD